MANEQKQRTAAQRIEDLEQGMMAMYQTLDQMARDLMTIKEAIKLLGNKMDSIVKASQRGEALTDEVISKIMVENNMEELKSKVQALVDQGVLVPAEEVTDTSFVVGREMNDQGEIQNPRMQFVLSALEESVRAKFPGSKVGQVLDLKDGKWKFEITETYNIVTPQVAQPAQEETKAESSETPAQ